jgi:glycine oxidase
VKSYDVVIAGGGLIGGSIALELTRAGLRVAVFDKQEPGREASWAGAGIISPAPENQGMIPLVPLGKASLQLYPQYVTDVEELSGQSVGFRPYGTIETLFAADAASELSTLVAVHRGLGLACDPLRVEEARELEPALGEDLQAAAIRPDEACVDNRALTAAVLEAAGRSGAEIHAGCGVEAIWREGNRCAGLVTQGGKISAGHTVIAAGCFSAAIEGAAPYAPVRPAKGQIIALRSNAVKIERVLWSERIYLVPRNDGRIIAGATLEYAGFDKTLTAGGIHQVIDAAIEIVPALRHAEIVETWAGLRPDSPDHLPILGPADLGGLLFATGHFRSGVLLAPVTAKLLREWVAGERISVDCDRFSPLRFLEGRAATSHESAR